MRLDLAGLHARGQEEARGAGFGVVPGQQRVVAINDHLALDQLLPVAFEKDNVLRDLGCFELRPDVVDNHLHAALGRVGRKVLTVLDALPVGLDQKHALAGVVETEAAVGAGFGAADGVHAFLPESRETDDDASGG